MHRPKDWRDDNIKTSAERKVCRMTDDLGYSITPLLDDAVAIDGHRGALAIASRAGSVHTHDHGSRQPPVHRGLLALSFGCTTAPFGRPRENFR
jgi:hypothetical protein